VEIWRKTPHYKSFKAMPRSAEAKTMKKKLGIRRIKTAPDCQTCHFTSVMKGARFKAISGTSCESCHGPSKKWLDLHSDYGGKGKKASEESSSHKASRLSASVKQGLIRPADLYHSFATCYACHTVPNERVVNQGGHVAGSDFEAVAWSGGVVRHNVWLNDGKGNPYEPLPRTRLKYVLGYLLDLEYGLRGLAVATSQGPYSEAMVKRITRAKKQLVKINGAIHSAELSKALGTVKGLQLAPNQSAGLLVAAGVVRGASKSFVTSTSGEKLSTLDKWLPDKGDYQ